MGQVTASALHTISPPDPQQALVSTETRAQTRAVAEAVRTLNAANYAGTDREVTFVTDSATRLPVVQVVDKQSGDVIVQWPSAYALQIAAQYEKHTSTEAGL